MINHTNKHTNRRFLIGGIFAAALPLLIGIILLSIPIIAENDPSCPYRAFRAKNVTSFCQFYHDIGEGFYWVIMLPIILSFIFVAPYVAAKSVSQLKEYTSLEWRDIFSTSISNSTKANFWVAIAYNIILLLIFIVTAIGMNGASGVLSTTVMVIVFAVFIQFILWLCITLPLALICAAIFGIVVRPKKNS